MAKPYVFISYSRQDRQFVDRLSSALNRNGIRTWVDTQNIEAGLNWQDEIEKALFKSDALIHVSSKHSAESQWLAAELQAFLRRNGRVIPWCWTTPARVTCRSRCTISSGLTFAASSTMRCTYCYPASRSCATASRFRRNPSFRKGTYSSAMRRWTSHSSGS